MKNFVKYISVVGLTSSVVFTSVVFTALAKSPSSYNDMSEIVSNNVVTLKLPQTLGIIYPKTAVTTTGDSFYIVGTSDPAQPLYINNQEFLERAPNGLFEVTVSVPQNGIYSCVFKQGDVTKAVPIFKNTQVDAQYNGFAMPSVINKAIGGIDSSIYPTQNVIINQKTVTLSCMAPSQATVLANFCGATFKLSQEKQTLQEGITTKYSVTVDLSSSLENGKCYNLGNVVYNINFKGNISEKASVGKVYYSEFLPQYVRVSWHFGFLRSTPSNNNDTISILKKGVVDRVVKEENGMYQLGCGGWINKKFVEPILEQIDINNVISAVSFAQDEKCEKIILKGTSSPVFTSGLMNDKLVVRLYNTTGNLDLSSLQQYSSLFKGITSKSENGYIEIIFNFKENNILWGYNVEYDGNDTIIYARKKPMLSPNTQQPLQNISVVVDPGHGGSDSGAPGLIGEVGGSCEKDVNLVNALAVKKRLEKLGAHVIMTRDSDKYVSLSDRAEIMDSSKPDFIVTLHADASGTNMMAKGLTIHYANSNNRSASLASLLAKIGSNYTERENRGAKNTDFYVSRSTVCPSVFGELGYLTNAADAISLFSEEKIFDIANAVGDALINYLKSDQM